MAQLSEFIREIITGEYAQNVLSWGKDQNGDYQPVSTDENGTVNVSQKGSNVELLIDVTENYSTFTEGQGLTKNGFIINYNPITEEELLDISKYKTITILIKNNTDVATAGIKFKGSLIKQDLSRIDSLHYTGKEIDISSISAGASYFVNSVGLNADYEFAVFTLQFLSFTATIGDIRVIITGRY